MSERLVEIFRKNAAFEKEAPYNFCDRWCERCVHERQARCRFFLDEFERKATCIAHGKEPDDHEMHMEVMEKQHEDLEARLEETAEALGIDFDDIDDAEPEKIEDARRAVNNDSLNKTAEQYHLKGHALLEKTFYKEDFAKPELSCDFKTVAWYHTLLPVKLKRALSGLHEPDDIEDFGICDAVAQLQVCKKAATQSIDALRKIGPGCPDIQAQAQEMIALLHNIHARIVKIEEGI